ncbi:hypothetical protein [Acidihalobacter prosperus]
MSSMSDKLSESVRKAKEQGQANAKADDKASANSKSSTTTVRKKATVARKKTTSGTSTRQTGQRSTSKAKSSDGMQAPEPSHGELFPGRIWPD